MTFEFSLSALRKGLAILLLPLVELVSLRLFLHYVWGLRFGFANTTDYDYLLPAPLALLLLVQVLESGNVLKLRLQRATLAANLLLVAAFLWVNSRYETLSALSASSTVVVWFALLIGIVLTSLCVWLSPLDYIKNPHRIAVLPTMLIASSLYFYMNGFRWFWNTLGNSTAHAMHFIFNTIPFSNVTAVFTPEDAVRIDHPALSVRIGIGCGGGDAFFYFTLAFLVVALIYFPAVRLRGWFLSYVGGVSFMYLLNLVRIIVLFYCGIGLRQNLGISLGTDLFRLLFHVHLGWLLYSVGIFFYLRSWCHAFQRGLFASHPKERSSRFLLSDPA